MRINEEVIRSFVCVCPTREAWDETAVFLNDLRRFEGFKWIAPEQIHITLRFLGDAAPSLVTKMDTALSGIGGMRRFRVSLAGAGAFPNLTRPKILWLGIDDGAPHLTRLASKLEQAARNSGFTADLRKFTPHLTIGRANQNGALSALSPELAGALREAPSPSWECASFVLMRSVLRPGGAIYTPIREYPL
ncbi:MAG: RNA 2',3'-cyclic phosphodiesterase [Synergistaceae bacterium]|nr:RNA 2',3'-cyclic phosphodiesterase [Synergistaceae bacterium]